MSGKENVVHFVSLVNSPAVIVEPDPHEFEDDGINDCAATACGIQEIFALIFKIDKLSRLAWKLMSQ
ncbi:hypothetical protein EVAR_58080_1 [Eumeta japonica]|uniref:Uncharacterized protein n=1 Tax=Eumeta variegata TaxID=151549 RepID=A0A4C1ZG70_EUMVA|nr:hypothetical protein EVAR_58080_1 [Eumeta japonica]